METLSGLSPRARAELLALVNAAPDGLLTAEAVVQHARNPESALFEYFEWDDEKAAHAQRLFIARSIVRQVKISLTHHEMVVKAPLFISAPSDRERDGGGYRTLTSIKTDAERSREVLLDEFARVVSALQRAEVIAKSLGFVDDIVAMRTEVAAFIERVRQSSAQNEPAPGGTA